MFTSRQQVNKQVQQILRLLPHKYQRNLACLAVSRIYHRIQDYPMAIKYLCSYLQARNKAVAHKLIAHFYRLLKNPDLDEALRYYQYSIETNPRQPDVIKEACKLLLDEKSIFDTDCARYWLNLATFENLSDDEVVISLRALTGMNISESNGADNNEDDGEDDGDNDGEDDGGDDGDDDDSDDYGENDGDDDGHDNRKLEKLEKELHVQVRSDEENEEVKFCNWAKARGLGLIRIRRDNTTAISGISMLSDENLAACAHHQIVAGMFNQDNDKEPLLCKANDLSAEKSRVQCKAPESAKDFQVAVANATAERKVKSAWESAKANMNLAALPAEPGALSLPVSTRAIAHSLFKKEHAKLKEAAELKGSSSLFNGASFMAIPLTLAALMQDNSLQGQKLKQLIKDEQELPGHFKRKLAPPKLAEVVRQENKERSQLLQKKSEKELDKKPGLNQCDALNPSLGFAPAALPVTGGFSFGALNTATSIGQNAKTNSSGAFRDSPFKFGPPDAETSIGSSQGLCSSKFKPSLQRPRASLSNKNHVKTCKKNKELLYVHRAQLYRLIDGDWKKCGVGDVKIFRHIETKELRVIMRQEKGLLCLDHPLNTYVVYRPMDSKSWIFAAYDFSRGEKILERFTMRFNEQKASQEFYSAVKSALNGTGKAI